MVGLSQEEHTVDADGALTFKALNDYTVVLPMKKKPPRVSVGITREHFDELHALAHEYQTSISTLSQIARPYTEISVKFTHSI